MKKKKILALITAVGITVVISGCAYVVYQKYFRPLPDVTSELNSILPTEVMPENKNYDYAQNEEGDFDFLEIENWPIYTDGEIHNIVYDEDLNNRYSMDFQRLIINNYGIESIDVPAVFTRNGEKPVVLSGTEKPDYNTMSKNTLIDNSAAYTEGDITDMFSRYINDTGELLLWKSIPFELTGNEIDLETFTKYAYGSPLIKKPGLILDDTFEQLTTKNGYPAARIDMMVTDIYDDNDDPNIIRAFNGTVIAWYANGCLNYGIIATYGDLHGDLANYIFINSPVYMSSEDTNND